MSGTPKQRWCRAAENIAKLLKTKNEMMIFGKIRQAENCAKSAEMAQLEGAGWLNRVSHDDYALAGLKIIMYYNRV